MKDSIYKDWQEWYYEDGFVKVEEQEHMLSELSTFNEKFSEKIDVLFCFESAANYILYPNINVIKEYNTTFIELMMNHSHKYNTKRIVPIHIIRSLIDVGAAFKAYLDSPDKNSFIEEYHKGEKYDKIDNQKKAHRHISYYVASLNNEYPFLKSLYEECCKYVHSSYYKPKSKSCFDCSINPGKKGFMGKNYKVKYEDFINDIIDQNISAESIPFDYEEEIDIINYCIEVNKMLLELVERIMNSDNNNQKTHSLS